MKSRSPWRITRASRTSRGRTDFIEADLRQPLAILSEAARTLDFGRPAMAIDAKAPGQMWAGVALKPAPKPALKP